MPLWVLPSPKAIISDLGGSSDGQPRPHQLSSLQMLKLVSASVPLPMKLPVPGTPVPQVFVTSVTVRAKRNEMTCADSQ